MTTFNIDKPIYRQIVDRMSERILRGEWPEGDRIPAVREYAVQLGVNPNTVMRAYEQLQSTGVLSMRRGIGYFVAPGAVESLTLDERDSFLAVELPALFTRMEMLGIGPDDIVNQYKIFKRNKI